MFIEKALLIFFQVEASAEALHTTGCVKNTLLAGKEWVATGAYINFQDGFDAERLEAVATGTAYCGLNIVWMDSLFHGLWITPNSLARSRN
jgi:hypothetical protein